MLNITTKIFVFVSLFFSFNQVMAKQVSGLYDVDILVTDESASVRWAAFKQGMDEVFVRISGDSIVMNKLKRPAPKTYVQRYSYEPVAVSAGSDPVTNEKGVALTHRIKIQYNGSAMEKYLLDNGFSIWDKHRPDVAIWLVVRDGTNEYVLKDADQSLLKAAADEALVRRGVPGHWPLYDSKDRKKLSIADIRGGFNDQVVNASKRYSSGLALTGSIIWNGKQWQSSWSLLMASGNRHWSLDDADYAQLINKAVDQAADALGVAFAVDNKINKQQLAAVRLDIQSVDSITRYNRVENYLTGLSSVEKAIPHKVDSQNAVFEVTLRSSEEDFLNLIKNGSELIKLEAQKVPEKDPLTDDQVPVPGPADEAVMNIEGSAPVEEIVENIDTPTPAAEQQDPVTVYYFRLNK